MSLLLFIIITSIFFLVSVSLAVFFLGTSVFLTPSRLTAQYYRGKNLPTHPSELSLPYENFTVTTNENFTLYGWYIPSSQPKGTIVYLHGVGDNKIGGLHLAKIFNENNFNVVLYDSRAHGESEGNFCTYGYYEKFDVQKILDEIEKKFQAKNIDVGKIGIYGRSMGAAIALQATSIEPRISAVISEGCFTTLRTITVDYQKRLFYLPWHFLRNIVMKRAEKIANFKHREVSPIRAVEKISCPLLFIHGENDTNIQHYYSELLFTAAGSKKKELYLVKNAHHNNIHAIGGNDFEKKVVSFFEKYLS